MMQEEKKKEYYRKYMREKNKTEKQKKYKRNYMKNYYQTHPEQKEYLKKYAREYARENKDHKKRILARGKQKREKLRLTIINHYGAECKCCGEKELRFLTIDHINGDGANTEEN